MSNKKIKKNKIRKSLKLKVGGFLTPSEYTIFHPNDFQHFFPYKSVKSQSLKPDQVISNNNYYICK